MTWSSPMLKLKYGRDPEMSQVAHLWIIVSFVLFPSITIQFFQKTHNMKPMLLTIPKQLEFQEPSSFRVGFVTSYNSFYDLVLALCSKCINLPISESYFKSLKTICESNDRTVIEYRNKMIFTGKTLFVVRRCNRNLIKLFALWIVKTFPNMVAIENNIHEDCATLIIRQVNSSHFVQDLEVFLNANVYCTSLMETPTGVQIVVPNPAEEVFSVHVSIPGPSSGIYNDYQMNMPLLKDMMFQRRKWAFFIKTHGTSLFAILLDNIPETVFRALVMYL